MKKRFFAALIVITAAAVLVVFTAGKAIEVYKEKSQWKNFTDKVVYIYDGDTVKLKSNEKVRLLGINAPETNHPDLPEQAYGLEAKQYLKKRILGKICKFEYNINEKYDKYGRLLAYIYYDESLINAEMVKKGLAYVYEKDGDRRVGELKLLENVARKFRRGIWENRKGIVKE